MTGALDRLRSRLIFLCLASLWIPGLQQMDIAAGSLRLGLVQPFKILFLAWLAAQATWIGVLWRSDPRRRAAEVSIIRSPLFLLIAAMDLALLIGTLRGLGGAPRGLSIWISLVLGQVGGLLLLMDPRLPRRAIQAGIGVSTLFLVACALLEYGAPDSALTIGMIRLFREDAAAYLVIRHQEFSGVGSSLTISALSEYCTRVLPFFLSPVIGGALVHLGALLLIGLSLFSLQRSSLLALLLMLPTTALYILGRRDRIRLLGGGLLVLAVFGVTIGPSILHSRYLGSFSKEPKDQLARSAAEHVSIRLTQLRTAVHAMRVHPITGIGLDGVAHLNTHPDPTLRVSESHGSHAHNLFLEFGASGGLGAFLATIAAFSAALWMGVMRAWRDRRWTLLLFGMGQLITLNTDCRIYVSWLAITLPWLWMAAARWDLPDSDP